MLVRNTAGVIRLSWETAFESEKTLAVDRIGLLKNEVRIYLRADGDDIPRYVLQLLGVFKLFDNLPRGQAVQISECYPHGSFGWAAPDDEPHHSVKISAGEDVGIFMAVSREIRYRMADRSEALNWPG
jgi:hypothetical protein